MTTPKLTQDYPSTPTPDQHISRLNIWQRWVTPHSKERDIAFRERSIRILAAVIFIGTALSLLPTFFLFESNIELVSYPTTTFAVMFTIGLAGIAVNQGAINLAGQLLTVGISIGAIGTALISGYWSDILLPTTLLILLLTALVLPRSRLLPTALAMLIGLTVIVTAQEYTGRQPTFEEYQQQAPTSIISNFMMFILLGALFLRQLRVEFDDRLAAMQASIEAADRARQEADRANQAKSQFLANMSHELRTPLNAIIGYTDIMLTGMVEASPDQQTRIQGNIKQNAQRLLAMINDTLDLSRIEAERVRVTISHFSPRSEIMQIVHSMESLTQQKNLELVTDFDASTPDDVSNDLPKLQQIITNLVGNAVKFTPEGQITVRTEAPNSEEWCLIVSDTGIGIPQDEQSHVFESFRQVESSNTRGYEGTGLGLAITKRLVNYLGGEISLESKLGAGSTFKVVFPRQIKVT